MPTDLSMLSCRKEPDLSELGKIEGMVLSILDVVEINIFLN